METDLRTDSVFAIGQKLHIVQHRRFEADVRRHFVGEVLAYGSHYLRLEGYMFVYDGGAGKFQKIPPKRSRIFAIDNGIAITVLPRDFDLSRSSYERDKSELIFTDGHEVAMEVGAFGVHG